MTQPSNHAILVLLCLPLVGAVLTAIAGRWGVPSARLTFRTNTGLSLLVAIVVAVTYRAPAADAETHVFEIAPLSGTTVGGDLRHAITPMQPRVALGLDGLNLWPCVFIPLLMFAVAGRFENDDDDGVTLRLVLLLLAEAAMLAVFLAADVILFVFALFLADLLPAVVAGRWGGHERRTATTRFLVTQITANLLIAVGLLAVTIGLVWIQAELGNTRGSATSIPRMLQLLPAATAGNETAYRYWAETGPWVFGILTLGCWIKSGIFPFHGRLTASIFDAPTPVGVLLAAVSPAIGLYGWLRFVLPLFPELLAGWSTIGLWFCLVAAVHATMLAGSQDDLRKQAGCLVAGQTSLALAAFFAGGITGSVAACLGLGVMMTGVPMLLLGVGELRDRFGTSDLEAFGGIARIEPGPALWLILGTTVLSGLPGTIGFARLWPQFAATAQISLTAVSLLLLTSLLTAWTLSSTLSRLLFGRRHVPPTGPPAWQIVVSGPTSNSSADRPDPSASETVAYSSPTAMVGLMIATIVLGVFPRILVDRLPAEMPRAALRVQEHRSQLVQQEHPQPATLPTAQLVRENP